MPRILIIVIVVIILLAGGGVTIMQQMELGPFAPSVTEDGGEGGENAANTENQQAVEFIKTLHRRGKMKPTFLALEPLVIPLFQGDKPSTTVQITVQIRVARDDAPEMRVRLTKLKDALLRDLMSFVPRYLRDNKKLEANFLGRRLKVVAERSVGRGLIDDVLVQSILDRSAGK